MRISLIVAAVIAMSGVAWSAFSRPAVTVAVPAIVGAIDTLSITQAAHDLPEQGFDAI